eukprot:4999618-Amphidinium_carterae.1
MGSQFHSECGSLRTSYPWQPSLDMLQRNFCHQFAPPLDSNWSHPIVASVDHSASPPLVPYSVAAPEPTGDAAPVPSAEFTDKITILTWNALSLLGDKDAQQGPAADSMKGGYHPPTLCQPGQLTFLTRKLEAEDI